MLFLVLKAVVFAVLLVAAVLTVWLSTPWGYRKGLYTRIIRRGSVFDSPQLLRVMGLAGTLYAVIGCVTTGLHMIQEHDRQLRVNRSVNMDVPATGSARLWAASYLPR